MSIIDDDILVTESHQPPATPRRSATPKPPKPPKTPKTLKPPKPPRRPPRLPRAQSPLTTTQILARGALALVAALLLGFVLNLMVLSHVQHLVAQQKL